MKISLTSITSPKWLMIDCQMINSITFVFSWYGGRFNVSVQFNFDDYSVAQAVSLPFVQVENYGLQGSLAYTGLSLQFALVEEGEIALDKSLFVRWGSCYPRSTSQAGSEDLSSLNDASIALPTEVTVLRLCGMKWLIWPVVVTTYTCATDTVY